MSVHIPPGVRRIIEAIGQPMTLRELTGSARTGLEVVQTFTNHATVGTVRMFKDYELGGLVQQGDRKVFIAAQSVAVRPKQNDKLLIDGNSYHIYAVNERKASGSEAIYIMNVRGV